MPVRLYRLSVIRPLGEKYGYFTPGSVQRLQICDDDCGVGKYKLVRPDPLDFYGSTASYGSFATGIGPMLARREVAEELAARFTGLTPRPIKVLKPRGKVGEELERSFVELRAILDVPPNPERSTMKVEASCPKCGRTIYSVQDVESEPEEERIGSIQMKPPVTSRKPGHGILVTEEEVHGHDFFRFNKMLICKERVREFVQDKDYTNAKFLEYGEIVQTP